MEQLRFTAVHEDGQHLVLSTADGTELMLPVDARLRAALRSRSAPADAPATPLSPRNVQAMIRAGQNPEEVAEITGWPAERVARFEGPILAEREHISGMAQAAHVRGRAPEGGVPTLGSRVLDRLAERGVDTDNVGWDATRPEGGVWTVVVSFVAGQRQRAAAWRFDPQDRTVEALDDEARWLSEDEQALPGVTAAPSRGGRAPAKPLLSNRTSAGEVELMTSMRERSRSRGRRKKTSTSSTDPAGLPQLEHAPEDVLPLEDLAYDPDTMGLPPAAHGESPAPDVAAEQSPDKEEATELAAPEGVDGDDGPASTKRARTQRGTAKRARASEAGADTDGVADRDGGPSAYDVPLQFDNDEDSHDEEALDDPEPERSPQDATLDDFFGPAHDEARNDDTTDDIELVEDAPDDDESGHDESEHDESGHDKSDDDDLALELGEEPLAEDAAELGGDLEDDDEADVPSEADSPLAAADGVEAAAQVEPDEPTEATGDVVPEDNQESETTHDPTDSTEKPAAKPKRRKDGRPGVPSWDDIMFGAKDRRS